ncbi:MAG: hypothetical protein HQ582_35005 [Planctomycetes bacterium]|nr:hypothetical protein [Planctomycetota bacterium]
MKTPLAQVLLLACVLCGWQAARADITRGRDTNPNRERTAPKVDRGESYVSVLSQTTGEPILVIRYPWKRHARPSVEVRILGEKELDNPLIRPQFFVHDVMKGDITKALYDCQDRSEDVPQRVAFSEGNANFSIFGTRNVLGRPSVCVSSRTTTVDSPPETRAAFAMLRPWSIDERTLYLELPAEHFSKRSKIRIWFLRGKDIVWMANTTWPGTPK